MGGMMRAHVCQFLFECVPGRVPACTAVSTVLPLRHKSTTAVCSSAVLLIEGMCQSVQTLLLAPGWGPYCLQALLFCWEVAGQVLGWCRLLRLQVVMVKGSASLRKVC
jgi:hypothetical protein